jgi:hypothetical protein
MSDRSGSDNLELDSSGSNNLESDDSESDYSGSVFIPGWLTKVFAIFAVIIILGVYVWYFLY